MYNKTSTYNRNLRVGVLDGPGHWTTVSVTFFFTSTQKTLRNYEIINEFFVLFMILMQFLTTFLFYKLCFTVKRTYHKVVSSRPVYY